MVRRGTHHPSSFFALLDHVLLRFVMFFAVSATIFPFIRDTQNRFRGLHFSSKRGFLLLDCKYNRIVPVNMIAFQTKIYFRMLLWGMTLREAQCLAMPWFIVKDLKTGYERRCAADANFPLKSLTEVVLAAGTQLAAEYERRGSDRIVTEVDFVVGTFYFICSFTM